MKALEIWTDDAQQTMGLGKTISQFLFGGEILCLFGHLGAGKTTFVKGVAMGLGVNQKKVNSPTFVLMNSYNGKIPLYHFDYYRLEKVDDIALLGSEEYLYADGVSVIEWAERMKETLPKEYLSLRFIHQTKDCRLIRITAKGKKYQHILKQLKEKNREYIGS